MALTLRLISGLTVPEIARALLQSESAVAQRITRAKSKKTAPTALIPKATPICGLSAVQKLALSGADDICVDKDQRETVKPGEYPVEFSVHIKGTVKVGEDTTTSQVNKIDPYQLLLLACDKLNRVTGESLIKEAEARAADPEWVKHAKELGERAKEAAASIREATKSPRKGPVTFNGIVIALDAELKGKA